MADSQVESNGMNQDYETLTEGRVSEMVEELLDIEAVAQMVEHLDFSQKLSQKLTTYFREVRSQSGRNANALEGVQKEIRDLIMDVALLKRAVASLGHIGVMERRRIEKELVRELFPPSQPRQGTGLVITFPKQTQVAQVDCENRLHLCKAACCRIFNVGLTPQEVEADEHDWDSRKPYALRKNRHGCVHLRSGGCECSIYSSRPHVCQTYSCEKDKRIWADFENKMLNPELEKRLESLDVGVTPPLGDNLQHHQGDPSPLHADSKPVASEPVEAEVLLQATMHSNGQHSHESKRPASSPNFDELRALMVPLPEKKFVPPKEEEKK